MASQQRRILNLFAFHRIIIPVVIGLAVIGYLIRKDISHSDMQSLEINWYSIGFFAIAIFLIAVRDLAYMYRIRLLTGKELSWRKSFDVIFLWEFASSVTPSVVGGSAIAVFILIKEKLGAGRSTAIVMVTALLDELFYIIMVPLVFLIAGIERLSVVGSTFSFLGITFGPMGVFVVGYIVIAILTLMLSYGVFINPSALKWLLVKLTASPLLKRLRQGAEITGDQIILASVELKGKPPGFWLRAFGATFFSWTARFWVVNFLIMGFTGLLTHSENLFIYARQLMMWVIMLISPTPGGSGIAEYFFPIFLREYIAGPSGDLTAIVALAWRLITYYPYLIIGAFILPFWLRRVYLGRRLIRFSRHPK
ncbi:MAG: lysylphosphatidylglycerol synthase transmembrane domain-containing protein [Bacteroidota bacterium]